MIVGIGHDLCEIDRVTSILEGTQRDRFIQRLLVDEEQTLAASYEGKRLHQFIAGRFAAKEAISKAFGCGIGATLRFVDLIIVPDHSGKPTCHISEQGWSRLDGRKADHHIHITITHEGMMASAFAIVERIV